MGTTKANQDIATLLEKTLKILINKYKFTVSRDLFDYIYKLFKNSIFFL